MAMILRNSLDGRQKVILPILSTPQMMQTRKSPEAVANTMRCGVWSGVLALTISKPNPIVQVANR